MSSEDSEQKPKTISVGRVATLMKGGSPALSRTDSIDSSDSEAIKGVLSPDPADLLVDRLRGWKSLVENLIDNFEELQKGENHMTSAHKKIVKVWAAPSVERDTVFGLDSWAHTVVKSFHDSSVTFQAQHDAIAKALDTQTVTSLSSVRAEIRKKLSALEDEKHKRDKERLRDKKEFQKLTDALLRSINAHRKTGGDVTKLGDPWINDINVRRHILVAQGKHEARIKVVQDSIRAFEIFEASILRNVKNAIEGIASLKIIQTSRAELAAELSKIVLALNIEAEWAAFREGYLSTASLPETIDMSYEGSQDPLVQIVKSGLIQRQSKGLIKSYKERYYILTAAGYLHEFDERPHLERGDEISPKDSIFLGHSTLGPLGLKDRKATEWTLTEKNEEASVFKRGSHVYKFNANSLNEANEWWAELSRLSKNTLATVDPSAASTPASSAPTSPAPERKTTETTTEKTEPEAALPPPPVAKEQ